MAAAFGRPLLRLPTLDLASAYIDLIERGRAIASAIDTIHAAAGSPSSKDICDRAGLIDVRSIDRLLVVQTLLPVDLLARQVRMLLNGCSWVRPIHNGIYLTKTCRSPTNSLRNRPGHIASLIAAVSR